MHGHVVCSSQTQQGLTQTLRQHLEAAVGGEAHSNASAIQHPQSLNHSARKVLQLLCSIFSLKQMH